MAASRILIAVFLSLLPACGGTPAPVAPPPAPSAPASASSGPLPAPAPPAVGADGWIEFGQGGWALKVRPDSHALSRVGPLADFLTTELTKVRAAMRLSDAECRGIVVYLHASSTQGPSKTRAFARWSDSGEVSAHYLADLDFDDRTELFRSLVPNELVKATTFACVRRSATDFLERPISALSWLMEGEGTLLHTGGWFGRDVDALTKAYIAAGIDYPIETILRSDYQRAWKFNPRVTHTFNIVEFPQMASFTSFLWKRNGNARFNTALKKVREVGNEGALNAIAEVYGAPVPDLEREWRTQLAQSAKQDPSLDPPRIARLVRRYQAVLEAAARALTFDDANVGPWGKRNAADIAFLPVVKLDLPTAEPAFERAKDRMVTELRSAAKAVEKGLGAKLSLPLKVEGGSTELLPEGCVVLQVHPGGRAQKMGLQKGDEVHLLDAAIHDALESSPGKPYTGPLRVTRGTAHETVLLEAK